jgi:hypothetical protein
MNLLVVEIVLGFVGLRRGWRVAPLLLVAASAAAFLYAPAGLAAGVAHGLALLGLVATCWAEPAERPAPKRTPGRSGLRRAGSLYQI